MLDQDPTCAGYRRRFADRRRNLALLSPKATSTQTDLANALERTKRLSSRVRQLEKRLSAMLGETAWTESGLGAAADIDQLQQRIAMLNQELAATRGQLDERTEEL
ncbi:hypothetical protein [Streptomyces sp. NPDC051219]|uniref:hypothetical protein n=1 Tax=Streptomyces sp. NPDC051219 TaxID=3155283 RepID=UPI0034454AA2